MKVFQFEPASCGFKQKGFLSPWVTLRVPRSQPRPYLCSSVAIAVAYLHPSPLAFAFALASVLALALALVLALALGLVLAFAFALKALV